MAEARKRRHSQIHPRNSAEGRTPYSIIPTTILGTIERGSNSSCELPEVERY
jgi:hypothetical protein